MKMPVRAWFLTKKISNGEPVIDIWTITVGKAVLKKNNQKSVTGILSAINAVNTFFFTDS